MAENDGAINRLTTRLVEANKEATKALGESLKDTFSPFADQITAPLKQLQAGVDALPGAKFTKKVFSGLTKPMEKVAKGEDESASAQVEEKNDRERYETSTQMIFEGILKGINGIQEGLIAGLAGLKDKGLLGLGILAGLVAAPFAAIAAFFSQIALEVKFLGSLIARMKEGRVFKAIGRSIDLFLDSFKTAFRTLFPKDYLANWKAGAMKVITAPLDLIKKALPKPLTNLSTSIDTALDTFKQGPFMRRLIGIQARFTKGMDAVRGFFGAVGRNVGALARGVQTVIDTLPGFKPIVDFAKGLGKIIGRIFFPIGFLMTAWDTIKGVISGYEEGGILGGLEGGITGLFNSLVGMPLDLLKSAVAWALGKLGFDEGAEVLKSFSFTQLISDAIGGIFDFIKGAFNWVGTLFTDPVTALKQLWTGLVGEGGFLDLITTPFNMAVNWLLGLFGWSDPDTEFNLLQTVKDTWNGIFEWFKGLLDIDVGAIVDSIPGSSTVLKALGIMDESPEEKRKNIEAAIKEAQDRISRSEGGENVYFGREGKGREEDAAEIAEMQKELELLKAEGGGTVVQNIQTNDNSTNNSQSTVTTTPIKDTAPPAGTVPAVM